jgi:hypothetical protein
MLSFGFADGRHLVISIEARKEVGESYTLTGGMVRKYELMYLFGDEHDVVLVRTNHRKDIMRRYPVNASTQDIRKLLLQMSEQANALHARPEFYNLLTDTCTSRLVKDVNVVHPGAIPASWRVLLPGYSDALAYDLGLINTTLSFADAREFYRIDHKAQACGDCADFSAQIRR